MLGHSFRLFTSNICPGNFTLLCFVKPFPNGHVFLYSLLVEGDQHLKSASRISLFSFTFLVVFLEHLFRGLLLHLFYALVVVLALDGGLRVGVVVRVDLLGTVLCFVGLFLARLVRCR